jgi:hypothetical protein
MPTQPKPYTYMQTPPTKATQHLDIKEQLKARGFKFNFLGTQIILPTKVPGFAVTVEPKHWPTLLHIFKETSVTTSFFYNEIIDLIQAEINKPTP